MFSDAIETIRALVKKEQDPLELAKQLRLAPGIMENFVAGHTTPYPKYVDAIARHYRLTLTLTKMD